MVRSRASGAMTPVRSTPCPRRVITMSRASSSCARATAAARSSSVPTRRFSSAMAPSDSRRDTALTAVGYVSQNSVGNGCPSASNGSFRMTSGCPSEQRATTVNGVVGSRPSCSRTISRSLRRSSPIDGRGSLALVLDRALVVDLPLLALAHELLQSRLEVRVAPPPDARRRRVLERLDREIDLAVFLDGDDLRLDDVALSEMVVHVLDIVAVDLGDVDEADLAAFQGQERPVRRDPRDGPVDDRPDL